MPTNEYSRSDFLKALLNQQKSNVASGGSLLNPSIGQAATLDTTFSGNMPVNGDVVNYDPQKEIKSKQTGNWLLDSISNIVGFTQEIKTNLLSGLAGAVEGVFDLGANAIGTLGDVTGWYSGDPFNTWAKQDIGGAIGNWYRTYDLLSGTNTLANFVNGTYFDPEYWKDMGEGALDILDSALFMSNQVSDFSEDAQKHYAFNENVLSDMGGFGEFLGGAAHSIGFMLPSIMLGNAAGVASGGSQLAAQIASLGSMGLSAAGKGAEEALNDGANSGQALGYGLASGAIEVAGEILIGKALKLTGLGTGKVMGVIGGGASKTTAKTGTKLFAKELLKTMNEEGMEEVFSGVMEPVIKSIYKGEDAFKDTYTNPDFWFGSDGHFNESVLGQYASGAFVGGLSGGIQTGSVFKKLGSENYKTMNSFQELVEADAEMAKMEKSKGFDANSKAYQTLKSERAEAMSNFISDLDSSISKSSQSQNKYLAELLTNKNALQKAIKDSNDVDKSINSYLENIKTKYDTHEKSITTSFLNEMQSKYGTNVVIEYLSPEQITKQYGKDASGANGFYIENKNKIVLNENILTKKGGSVLAHEYFAHALSSRFSKGTVREVFNDLISTNEGKEIAEQLRRSTDYNFKNAKNSDIEYQEEILGQYLERIFNSSNLSSQINNIKKTLTKNKFQKFVDNVLSAFNKETEFGSNKVTKEYAKTLNKFLKGFDNNGIRKIAYKDFIGAKLSEREQKIKDKYKNVVKAIKTNFVNELAREFRTEAPAYSKPIDFAKRTKDENTILEYRPNTPVINFMWSDAYKKLEPIKNLTTKPSPQALTIFQGVAYGKALDNFLDESNVLFAYTTHLWENMKATRGDTAAMFTESFHNLSTQEVMKAIQGIEKPLFVFRSTSPKTGLPEYTVVVNVKDSQGRYLLVAIEEQAKLAFTYRTITGHRIKTITPKNRLGAYIDTIQHSIENGKIKGEILLDKTNKIKFSKDLDSEGNYLSEKQQEFFKDSAVRDDNGNLMVVYHSSSTNDFNVFKHEFKGKNTLVSDTSLGFFFATQNDINVQKQFGDKTRAFYLNIKNPLNLEYFGHLSSDAFSELTSEEQTMVKALAELWKSDDMSLDESIENVIEGSDDIETVMEFREWFGEEGTVEKLKELGFDGVKDFLSYSTDGKKNKIFEYIAFDSNQIKDITNVAPTEDPDIRFSKSLNSDGQKISETQETFFKDSKIRDKKGNLMVVYHGSPSTEEFTVFDSNKFGENTFGENAFFFTDRQGVAEEFSYEVEPVSNLFVRKTGRKGTTRAFYLNIKNPVDFRNLTAKQLDIIANAYAEKQNLTPIGQAKYVWETEYTPEEMVAKRREIARQVKANYKEYDTQTFKALYYGFAEQELRDAGYDGFICPMYGKNETDTVKKGALEFAAFEPNQIKLVDNYEPTDDIDIRFSKDLSEDELATKEFNKTKETLDEIGSEAISYEEYMTEETDYKESHISKRFVNKLNKRSDDAVNRLLDIIDPEDSDIDYELVDMEKVDEIYKEYANEDYLANLQEVLFEVDNLDGEEPKSFEELGNRIQDLYDYLENLNNNYDDIKQGYIDYLESKNKENTKAIAEKYNGTLTIQNRELSETFTEEDRKKYNERKQTALNLIKKAEENPWKDQTVKGETNKWVNIAPYYAATVNGIEQYRTLKKNFNKAIEMLEHIAKIHGCEFHYSKTFGVYENQADSFFQNEPSFFVSLGNVPMKVANYVSSLFADAGFQQQEASISSRVVDTFEEWKTLDNKAVAFDIKFNNKISPFDVAEIFREKKIESTVAVGFVRVYMFDNYNSESEVAATIEKFKEIYDILNERGAINGKEIKEAITYHFMESNWISEDVRQKLYESQKRQYRAIAEERASRVGRRNIYKTINDDFYDSLDNEHKKMYEEINDNKYLGDILHWELHDYLDVETLEIAHEYMFARDGKGVFPSLERIEKTKAYQYGQEYVKNNERLETKENPRLLERVSEESYDIITKGKKPVSKGKKPTLFLATGLPAAGKSTTGVNEYIKNGFVENDNDIFKGVPSLEEYYKNGIGANVVQEIVGEAQENYVSPRLFSERFNIAVPLIGKHAKSYVKWLKLAKEHGYKVIWRHVDASIDLSGNGSFIRFLQTGRFIPFDYIKSLADVANVAKKIYNEKGIIKYENNEYRIDDWDGTNRDVFEKMRTTRVREQSSSVKSEKSKRTREIRRTETVSSSEREGVVRGDALASTDNRLSSSSEKSAPSSSSTPAPVVFKNMETTKDIVTQSKDYISAKLGKDYKVAFPRNFEKFSGKAFTEINNVKTKKAEARHLVNLLLDTTISAKNSENTYETVGTLKDLLTKKEIADLTTAVEGIISASADTTAKSIETLPFEKSLDKALDIAKQYNSAEGRNHILTRLRDSARDRLNVYGETLPTDTVSVNRNGLNILLNPILGLHTTEGKFTSKGVRKTIEDVLRIYNEETVERDFPELPFDNDVRQALIDLYDSLGAPVEQVINKGKPNESTRVVNSKLTSYQMQKAIDYARKINKYIQDQSVRDATKIRPAVRQAIAEIKSMPYSKKSSIAQKLFRAWKRGFAPAYVILEQMFGGNTQLAKTLTVEMQNAVNKKTLYTGGYADIIQKKLKELGIRKTFSTKTFAIENTSYTADELVYLYISLNVEANFNAIDENGIQKYDNKSDKLSPIMYKGKAGALKESVNRILPSEYKKLGNWLLDTINDSVKSEYIQMYENKFGKYQMRNEIGEVGKNTYWMLNRSYQRMTNAEKAMSNPAGVFAHAKARVDTQNAVLVGGALSGFTGYIDQLGSELYVKPVYRDALSMLNTKSEQGTNGKTVMQVLAMNVESKDMQYLKTTLSDILGAYKGKTNDLFSRVMSTFSVAKLALNLGTMLKQFASIWTSNIPMNKSFKGFFSNLFKSSETKAEYKQLVDEIGGLKYRESNAGVLRANADSAGEFVEKVAKYGMIGISKVDLFTISTGVVSMMHIAQDQFGYKIGTKENADWVKQHWSEFELSQIGQGALSKNAISRGDYGTLTKVIFGFLQGANRAAFGSQIHKLGLYSRNKNINIEDYKSRLKQARDDAKYYLDDYNLDNSEENRERYIQAQTEVVEIENKIADYNSYKAAGGKAIPVNMGIGLVTQGLFIALINALIRHIKGKDDWDEWEFFNDPMLWLLNTAKTIGLDWLPFFNAISSALLGSFERDSNGNIVVGEGYEVTVPVVEIANNFVDIFNDVKEGKVNWYQILSVVGDMTGIPLSTLKDYTYGAIKTFNPAIAYKVNSVLYGYSLSSATKTLTTLAEKGDVNNTASMIDIIISQYKTGGATSQKVLNELATLYVNGYNALPRSYMTEYTTESGSIVKLTSQQIEQFQKYYQKSEKAVKELLEVQEFQSMTQEERAKLIKKIYDIYYDFAKVKVTGVSGSSKFSKILALTNGNINVGKIVAVIGKVSQITETTRKTRKELVIDYINRSNLSRQEKILTMYLAGYSVSGTAEKTLTSYLSSYGASRSDIQSLING